MRKLSTKPLTVMRRYRQRISFLESQLADEGPKYDHAIRFLRTVADSEVPMWNKKARQILKELGEERTEEVPF